MHGHHHDHHPGSGSGDVNLETNRDHFDKTASEYDNFNMGDVTAYDLSKNSAAVMMKAYSFDPEKTVVMDFACGTGLISRELVSHAKTIVGVDISHGMVDQYNKRIANENIPAGKMEGLVAELKGEDGELDGMKFDVIVCSVAYHHFTSPEAVTHTLVYFLKTGGALLVVDFAPGADMHALFQHADIPKHVEHTVPHKAGFSEDNLKAVFEGAGLREYSYSQDVYEREVNGHTIRLFIAKGVKA